MLRPLATGKTVIFFRSQDEENAEVPSLSLLQQFFRSCSCLSSSTLQAILSTKQSNSAGVSQQQQLNRNGLSRHS